MSVRELLGVLRLWFVSKFVFVKVFYLFILLSLVSVRVIRCIETLVCE